MTKLRPNSESFNDTAAMVDRAAWLKERANQLTQELRELNLCLAGRGLFLPGASTGYVYGHCYRAKIQLRENIKWDQTLLTSARAQMGDDEFFRVFKWVYEPHSAKILAGALDFGRFGDLLGAARQVSAGAPGVTFEKIEPGQSPAGQMLAPSAPASTWESVTL